MAEDAIDKMKTNSGSVIIPDETSVVAKIFRDKIDLVANAIGTSIYQIKRDEALQDAEQKAREQPTLAGSVTDSIEVVEEIPLVHHLANAPRLRMKVVGNLV
ncbi:TPA: hypothetical protein U0Z15_003072 [Listeria monocytogenes]|uniref:Uncharacterized protein n=1 Tax=Listeria monocytogenes TaxID=1639 RepID=A0A9P1X3H4_LISMN|nr:hypothetical protein Y193_13355 [Listeria monocytogenes]EAE1679692.1 hypothetical protein [Listeria monocytogenes LIS0071]EAL09873.1 conserved domain protein [Listeria monocytogenes str. 4b H7858] [Listeria monocytogenes serotype 4b str. H7858]MCX59740.1 hypothetical protein [Listeria monocytogenes serotype 4b]AJA82200.1 hypothetical protein LO81_516 [Listeria monocytogenes]